jgi:4'-phosphopantetheinyl transferase
VIPAVYWLTQASADVPADDSWLSEREQAIAGRMYFEKRRQDWRLGRWTAKRAVSGYLALGVDPSSFTELEIIAAADGAPEAFREGIPAPVSLSISHSAELAFCSVASPGTALGCDLELIQAREPNFAADYFTAEELDFLERTPVTDRPLITNLIWSAKESALKALREGLRRDTRSIQVQLAEARHLDWTRFTAIEPGTPRFFYGWWRIYGNHVMAVATDSAGVLPVEIL